MGLSPELNFGWSGGKRGFLKRGQKKGGERMVSMGGKKLAISEIRNGGMCHV